MKTPVEGLSSRKGKRRKLYTSYYGVMCSECCCKKAHSEVSLKKVPLRTSLLIDQPTTVKPSTAEKARFSPSWDSSSKSETTDFVHGEGRKEWK